MHLENRALVPQLSWTFWCGESSEKAGTATSKRSPFGPSIWYAPTIIPEGVGSGVPLVYS